MSRLNCAGSAHGIQFMNKNYVGYRDKCLELGGIQYQHLERYWHANYNPFGLQRITVDQSQGSQASDTANSCGQ